MWSLKEAAMKRMFALPLIAVALLIMTAGTVDACYCGAARLRCLRTRKLLHYGVCQLQTSSATRSWRPARKSFYEKRQYTCYKTCYQRVCEQKTINCVKYVPETCYRECTYTVCKPVWETRVKTWQLHRLQASLGNQEQRSLLHGMQARHGSPNQGNLLYRMPACLENQEQKRFATRYGKAGFWVTPTKEKSLLYRMQSLFGKPRAKRICYQRYATRHGNPD